MKPVLSGFTQLAYVTNDLDHAIDVFGKKYGIPSFYRLHVQFPGKVHDAAGVLSMNVALANVPGVQIELIEPTADVGGFYTAALTGKTEFTMAFHHVLQRLGGDLSNWDRHFAELEASGRVIACLADAGEAVRLVFTDDREMLGAYVEHIWMTPQAWREIDRQIPFHSAG